MAGQNCEDVESILLSDGEERKDSAKSKANESKREKHKSDK